MNIYLRIKLCLKTISLISWRKTGWQVKVTIMLNDDVIWVKPNMVNINGMDYGRWNEWGRPWSERNESEIWKIKFIMSFLCFSVL